MRYLFLHIKLINQMWFHLPLTFSWYFFSVLPASLEAVQVYSPLSSGDTEARISRVPSSKMDTPGSFPVSSWPFLNHLITGWGKPAWWENVLYKAALETLSSVLCWSVEDARLPLAGQGNAMRWFATLSCSGLLKGGSETSTTGGTIGPNNQLRSQHISECQL